MVTYGFELMWIRYYLAITLLFLTENIGHFLIFYFSAHNLFRLIECRDFDMNALKGIIFYFSCGLHAYSLNREAKYFEFTQFLVDGAHWQGQKKLKKPDSSSKKGHIGCSDGYNYNLYKKHLGINQQVFQSM